MSDVNIEKEKTSDNPTLASKLALGANAVHLR